MWTLPQITAYIQRRTPAFIGFLDDCLKALGWIILAVFAGVVLLYFIYWYFSAPLHPSLWRPFSSLSGEIVPS